jgi:hypothetical protein
MTDIKQGFQAIKKFLEKQEKDAIKGLSFDFLSRVQQLTPVDTGRARAGWRISQGKNENEMIVYNGVEYVVFLEYGHSRQAPQGMVRVSLAETKNKIR